MRNSRIVSVIFVAICALAAVIPACVASEPSISSSARGYTALGEGSAECTPPEQAGPTSSGSGSGSSMPPVVVEPSLPGTGSGGYEVDPIDPGGTGGDTYGGYGKLKQDGFPDRDYKMLEDGTVVFAGGPAPNEATCAGACFARGCGAYTWSGNITTGCKCFLNPGWKWCLSSSCNPAALAAGGAVCTAATCP